MKKTSLFVELVGPAGAGKTTLCQALLRLNKKVLIGIPPDVWNMASMPFYARNAVVLLPTFLRLYSANGRWFTRQEIALMLILNGWPRVLGRQASNADTVTIIDQGAVLMLAQLHQFGPNSLRGRSAKKWLDGVYRQWATTLDMVVYLDASDRHLIERIRMRAKWHLAKEKTEREVIEFLKNYRVSYQQVISILSANHRSLRVLRFDTSRESPYGIMKRLLIEFGLKECEGEVVR